MPAGDEAIDDFQNHESPTFRCIKDTSAIRETAGFIAEFANLQVAKIKDLHGFDRLRHLLSIGADILHGSCAYGTRNTAETLDTCTVVRHGVRDEVVPIHARAYVEYPGVTVVSFFDSSNADVDDQTRPAGVRNENVAAPAKHK